MSDDLNAALEALQTSILDRGSVGLELARAIKGEGLSSRVVRSIRRLIAGEVRQPSSRSESLIDAIVSAFQGAISKSASKELFYCLLDCSSFYYGIGKHSNAVSTALSLLSERFAPLELDLHRRIHNSLGGFYLEAANFQASLEHLDQALTIARQVNDPVAYKACLANCMAALKELGHYRDAINVSMLIMATTIDHPADKFFRFQCAGNGLFCAHRLQDPVFALKFLEAGNELLHDSQIEPVSKAIYEYYRAAYLIDVYDQETAEELIIAARRNLAGATNPRVEILLEISSALCDWASREDRGRRSAQEKLRFLYAETKNSKICHDEVLRALMKVHGDAVETEVAKQGMRYAQELVEFTTSVKRAKFYRQLVDRGVQMETANDRQGRPYDPFSNARRWFSAAQDEYVADDLSEGDELAVGEAPRFFSKHEELSSIHDDLAKLRTQAIIKELRSAAYDTAENWALAAEFFDDQTGQHCFRVGHLAGMLAREIGLDESYSARIEHAARLHDIGKIGVNEMVLLKPGPLDPSELTAMRAHAEVGAFMLQGAKDPVLQLAAVIAKHHHEWWNGAGYPASIANRRIPLAARICALADVYDALTHARPYKGAWPHRVAVEEMLNLAGVQFDPHLIRPFMKVLERYVPALSQGRIPGLEQLKENGLIASRQKLMNTISLTQN